MALVDIMVRTRFFFLNVVLVYFFLRELPDDLRSNSPFEQIPGQVAGRQEETDHVQTVVGEEAVKKGNFKVL